MWSPGLRTASAGYRGDHKGRPYDLAIAEATIPIVGAPLVGPPQGAIVRPIRHKQAICGLCRAHPGDDEPILRYC